MSAFIRILKHLSMTPFHLQRVFPESALQAITAAVAAGEAQHGGEIRVAIEVDLPLRQLLAGQTPRQRAIEVFAQLGVWDTDARNGVLLYLCLADHSIEIVADRGYEGRVTAAEWTQICRDMETQLRSGEATLALCNAIKVISDRVAPHFPRVDRNELSDRPALL